MTPRDELRLKHILKAIDQIEKYSSEGKERFESDELVQNWIVRHLGIIGEACAALSKDLKARQHEIPWSEIIGMRNVIVHEYFRIDAGRVWLVIEKDLSRLKTMVEQILNT